MNIIEEFIIQYNKEFDYYQKLSQIIANKIEDQLFKRGVKAIVTFRAKKPDRLFDKLVKRNEAVKYKSVSDVYNDIVDLSGIRVSLYFPSERELLDEIINEIFEVTKKKDFPNEAHTPKYTKRFSGYWASHYRVKLKEDNLTKRYTNTLAEIQVASVLMHAWSEVEHDLVYKPYSGDLSKEELSILDEINGLVLAGEIALERLQTAMAERTEKSKNIDDKYELTNYIYNKFKDDNKVKIGNTYLINNFLKSIDTIETKTLKKYLNQIDLEDSESISNQLFDLYINNNKNLNDETLKRFVKNLNLPKNKANIFEKFVRAWSLLDKTVDTLIHKSDKEYYKHLVTRYNVLVQKNIISKMEYDEIERLREIRNHLVHNLDIPTYLNSDYDSLVDVILKLITKIEDIDIRNLLLNQLKNL